MEPIKSKRVNKHEKNGAVLDSYLVIDDIRRYFDNDGWTALQQVVEIKRMNPTWICTSCNEDSSNNSICCNRCLDWFHFKCVNVKPTLKKKIWFCSICKVTYYL